MTYEQWYKLILADPLDWDQRLVFADWLEEQGAVDLSHGQRWQVEHQRCSQDRSVPNFPNKGNRWLGSTPSWYWMRDEGYRNTHDRKVYQWQLLPNQVFDRVLRLNSWSSSGSTIATYKPSLVEAEQLLALALKEL